MQEKIRAKMEKHVESILEKPEITAEEYMLISAYLAKLEMEEERAKIARSSEKTEQRCRAMIDAIWGGAENGV